MAKNKEIKTNAMRILETKKIPYVAHTYECDEFVDGIQIADMLQLPYEKVYKTLVTQGNSKNLTGYIRGGCSPIGMKKQYVTKIAQEAKTLEKIIVSGGKLGMQLELTPQDLATAANAEFADILVK